MKRAPSRVQALELGEDGVLGGGVDDEREVAALAALAGLDDALRARRMVAEHRRAGPRRRGGRRRANRATRAPRAPSNRWPCASYPRDVPVPPGALTPAQLAVATHRGGPLLVLGAAGTGKTRTLVHRHAWLAAEGGRAGAGARPHRLGGGRRHRPRRGRGAARPRLRGARRPHRRGLQRPPAARRGARGGPRPVRLARHAGRPPRDAARARRRADAAPARLPRQPGRAPRRRHRPDRPAEGRDGHRRRVRALGGRRCRRATTGPSASASSAPSYSTHDRLLAQQGALDFGDLVLHAHALLRDKPHVRARAAARYRHLLVDDAQDLEHAAMRLVLLLAGDGPTPDRDGRRRPGDPPPARRGGEEPPGPRGGGARAAHGAPRGVAALPGAGRRGRGRGRPADRRPDRQAPRGARGRHGPLLARGERARPGAGGRGRGRAPRPRRRRRPRRSRSSCARCATRGRRSPWRSRSAPCRTASPAPPRSSSAPRSRTCSRGCGCSSTPPTPGAVVRALARPPVELRSIDLARCVQISRRRKLDMVSALVAATESPQLPPEARERILGFLKLHRSAAAALDTTRPDVFVHRLIDRLGLRRRQLFAAQADVVERLVALARLGELATAYVRRSPQSTPREFARSIAAVAEAGLRDEEGGPGAQGDSSAGGHADRFGVRAGAVAVMAMQASHGLSFEHVFVLGLQSSRMPGARRRAMEPIPDALLHETLPPDTRAAHVDEMRRVLHVAMTRARSGLVLAYATRSDAGALQPPSPFAEEARDGARRRVGGARRGPVRPRRDRPRDLPGAARRAAAEHPAHRLAPRRAAPRHRPRRRPRRGPLPRAAQARGAHEPARRATSVADALPGINAAILRAATPEQREILQTSSLDDLLLDAERDARARAAAIAARDEPSLEPFLPTRGDGLLLSASDIETYRTCPLKYKFARVFRIPSEPTMNQRFGILVHQVLERYHSSGGRTLDELLGLLEAGWRRGGFGSSDEERQLRVKADTSLRRYHDRTLADDAEPVWFEKSFQFKLGAHTLRGRVDRVDRLPDGGYELIDYKTGRPEERRPAPRGRPARALRGRRAPRRGTSTRRASPTSTSSTTRRCRCRPTRSTAAGSPTPSSRWPTGSSARGSSRRRPTPPARCATTASPARRPSGRRSPARPPGKALRALGAHPGPDARGGERRPQVRDEVLRRLDPAATAARGRPAPPRPSPRRTGASSPAGPRSATRRRRATRRA